MGVPIKRGETAELGVVLWNAGSVVTSPPIVAGDFQVSVDFGAFENVTAVEDPASSGQVKISLTADQTDGVHLGLRWVDQAGDAWDDGYESIITDVQDIGGLSEQIGDLVGEVWDELLTGVTHNIATSAGKRVRELSEQIGYSGGAIWIDTVNGVAGTTLGENGTANNPVDSIVDALTLAVAAGLVRMHVASGSTITLAAALEGYELFNYNWTLELGGQSVSGSCFIGANVSGVCTGAIPAKFIDCHFIDGTIPPSHSARCGLGGTIALASAGTFFFDACHSSVAGTSAPTLDFGSGLNASNINFRHYSGGIEIENMGAGSGAYNMSLEGFGQLIINANCSGGTIAIRGHFTVTDNAGGVITLSDDARFDVPAIEEAVWDNDDGERTLTQDAASVIAAVTGSDVARYRGTFWDVTLSGLASLADRDDVHFAIKEKQSDSDDDAILLWSEDGGLLRVNGAAAAEAADGVLTVPSGDTSVRVTLKTSVSAMLEVRAGMFYGIKRVKEGEGYAASEGGRWDVVADTPRGV